MMLSGALFLPHFRGVDLYFHRSDFAGYPHFSARFSRDIVHLRIAIRERFFYRDVLRQSASNPPCQATVSPFARIGR